MSTHNIGFYEEISISSSDYPWVVNTVSFLDQNLNMFCCCCFFVLKLSALKPLIG